MATAVKNSVDCAVVGGGIIGTLSALLLARAGLSIALYERGALFGESSWAGGGILSPLVPWRYPDAVNALSGWSQHAYPPLLEALQAQTGIDPEYTRNGMLLAGHRAGPGVADWCRAHGCAMQVLDDGRLHAEEPALARGTEYALLLPEVAQVRNPRLGKAIGRALRQLGVVVHEHQPVRQLVTQGGRIAGLVTGSGLQHVERVVLAAGAWASELLADCPGPPPVRPVRGQMLVFAAPPGMLRHIICGADHYLIPRRDGLILAGSTVEEAGFDRSPTAAGRTSISDAAFRLVPDLAGYPLRYHWAGLRPAAEGGLPVIGEHPQIRHLYLNYGHFRNGLAMAPASARLLVDVMLGRDRVLDPAPFRP